MGNNGSLEIGAHCRVSKNKNCLCWTNFHFKAGKYAFDIMSLCGFNSILGNRDGRFC